MYALRHEEGLGGVLGFDPPTFLKDIYDKK